MNWISLGLITVIAAAAQTPIDQAQQLNDLGNQFTAKDDYVSAQKPYQDAIVIWRSLGPEYEAHLAATLVNLGLAYYGAANRPEAAKAYEEALVLHRRTLGLKNHRTIINMNLLACTSLMLGNIDRADKLVQELLPIERELYPGDIQMARTLEAGSNILIARGQASQALPLAEEALSIALKAAGENGMEAALAWSGVAEAHRCSGRSDRALPLYRKARAIYEHILGPEHPQVAAVLSQEGLILMDDNKLSLAEQAMVKSVKLLRKGCPDCILELAIAENNLGILRLKQKRYHDADESLSNAIALREKFDSRPGRELADSLHSLAFAREKQRLFEDAARLNTLAESIRSYR